MAVMIPRETSTDQCLSDLEKKVDVGFAKVDERFKQVDDRFAKVDERFDRLEARMETQFGRVTDQLGQLHDRFDRMQQTLFGAAVAVCVALIGSTATLAGIAFF